MSKPAHPVQGVALVGFTLARHRKVQRRRTKHRKKERALTEVQFRPHQRELRGWHLARGGRQSPAGYRSGFALAEARDLAELGFYEIEAAKFRGAWARKLFPLLTTLLFFWVVGLQ